MQPIFKHQWCIKGSKPTAPCKTVYEWLYLYGFVNPATGENFWLILPTVDTKIMSMALDEFSRYINPNGDKYIVLMIDNAGWHVAKDLEIPDLMCFCPLPAYTPELQPVERVWGLFKEMLANRNIDSMEDLMEIIYERCKYLNKKPEIIASHCGFHWIKEISNHTT